MERINKVKIENFRNIKSLEFSVNSDATIVAGKNGIGKSNVVNALVWFFTDSIYTDNLGVGENDINSIVPNDQVKGERVAVEITFSSNAVLRKEYVTGYDRTTGKANKHTTKGYVNGVESKNLDEFKAMLYKLISYEPTITNIKEINLFVDPLYALHKIDSKELRQFLMQLGCSVTNEELFNLGFEDLRQYESKYLGSYTVMRTDLKKQIKLINESLKKFDVLRSQYNDVEEVSKEKINKINSQIDELNEKKSALKVGGTNDLIKEKTIKLNTMISSFDAAKKTKLNSLDTQKQALHNEIELLKKNQELEFEQRTANLKSLVINEQSSVNALESQIDSLDAKKDALRKRLAIIQTGAKQMQESKQRYSDLLLQTKSKEFTGYVHCPNCNCEFAPNEDELISFNNQKASDEAYCTKQIASANLQIEKYVEEVNEIRANAQALDKQIADLKATSIIKQGKADDLIKQLESLTNETSNENKDKLEDLNKQVQDIELQIEKVKCLTTEDEASIMNLRDEISELSLKQNDEIQEAITPILNQINELEEKRQALYVQEANYNNKLSYNNQYDQTLKQLNDTETLASRVDEFIHKMIACINSKAKELTGIEFVMLEENIGNDGIKEVCYALVDGVPFANVNTAKKYITGIRFIQRVKEIIQRDFDKPRNTLPILADKFEGIDSVTTIKNLTTATGDQLICSRVSDDNEMRFM